MVGDCHQASQFPGLYRGYDLQRRFEIVLMFSTGESSSPTQNLTTMRNSMSSLDAKRCFEVMAIKRCCEVTTQHNVFKGLGSQTGFFGPVFCQKVYNHLQSYQFFFFYLNTYVFQICKNIRPKSNEWVRFDVL